MFQRILFVIDILSLELFLICQKHLELIIGHLKQNLGDSKERCEDAGVNVMIEYFNHLSYEKYERGFYKQDLNGLGWIEVNFKTLEIPKIKTIVEKAKSILNERQLKQLYKDLIFIKFKFNSWKLKDGRMQFSSVNWLTHEFRAVFTISYYE